MIGRAEVWEGNLSEKLRIGTLPIEELLAHKRIEAHTVSPSKICTSLTRSGALARAVHKANNAQRACLAYALRGGGLSAFTPPFTSLARGEAPNLNLPAAWKKRKKSPLKKNQPEGWKRPKAEETNLTQCLADPPEAETLHTNQPAQDLPEARRAANPYSLPKHAYRPMQEPCRSAAQADPETTLSQRAKPPAFADDQRTEDSPALTDD